jgi:hypothetical protein
MNGEGELRVFQGRSEGYEGKEPSLVEAIADAARVAGVAEGGEWFDVIRIQAEVLPHNQWVRVFSVIVTPSGS